MLDTTSASAPGKARRATLTLLSYRRSVLIKTLPWVLAVLGAKYAAYALGWELLTVNALLTSIVAGNVFLLGILLAGVLADYKESERLPGELSVSVAAIEDDARALVEHKQLAAAKDCLVHITAFVANLKKWLHKKERTQNILRQIGALTDYFVGFEPHVPANFIVRLKQEQSNLRRIVSRIDTIRDTSFVSSAYRIAEVNSMALLFALVVTDVRPLSNALFFTGVISLLFLYVLALIRDLDNPFGFYEDDTYENVPLKLLDDLEARLHQETQAGAVAPPAGAETAARSDA